ncbi:MAG: 4Fe-4S dicluster domain-containing protein [Acidobacteriota bacterium]
MQNQLQDCFVIASQDIEKLLAALINSGYRTIGPTIRDGAIIYDDISSISDLPIGWIDEQNGGTYRIKQTAEKAFFGYTVGPYSWKRFLHPPNVRLWQLQRRGNSLHFIEEKQKPEKFAFIGVRACELHAIQIQDRVLINDKNIDPIYATRREKNFILAINCARAGGTCFCASVNTGPKVSSGFDLALTEILTADNHYFVVEVGSAAGAEILAEAPHRKASVEDNQLALDIIDKTAKSMGRTMNTDNIKELLYRNLEHKRWDEVATRCLTCANCTMVCPTCFCTTVEDTTDLTGEHAERWRKWDSCFTMDFSYIHGGSIRSSTKSRYRQWMTHKLATWIDQFGTTGCVGCGRCITWCPVAIDITEEVRVIRETEEQKEKGG